MNIHNSFQKLVIAQLLNTLSQFQEKNAFCINETFYNYGQLAECISKIRKAIQTSNIKSNNIGLVANDDIETYASIIAIWLEGLAYVPLHPLQPIERIVEIINQAEIKLLIDSIGDLETNVPSIKSSKLIFEELNLLPQVTSEESIVYILFTSGSTGKPKGVPITRSNIGAFVESFGDLNYTLDENDKFLQPFDLTFDLSVISYLIPLIKGGCIYSVPYNQIKYSYIAQLLEDHSITFALMVPSTIRYLRPFFSELDLPSLKYSLFCGEGLPLDLVSEWSICIPNAIIDNVYGPTEDTIFCSQYRFTKEGTNKTHNGILSIGKSMTSGKMIIVDAENKEITDNQQGELCLFGDQLTPGYWNNPDKNKEAFFIDNIGQRFYKTGDICFKDSDGDFMYAGRLDNQVKVQGFRIELAEIEFHASEFLKGINAVAVAFENKTGNTEIALFIEADLFDTKPLFDNLKQKMPQYMIPTETFFKKIFPLNSNGKTDRNNLKKSMFL